MPNNEYTFLMIPDLNYQSQSYRIYKGDDRSKPIAMIVFEDKDNYEIFNLTDLAFTNLEELNIASACEKFRHDKFFYNWD